MSNHPRVDSWPTEMKHEAYELSIQGLTPRDIAAEFLHRHGPSAAPNHVTVWRWLTADEAKPLLQRVEARVRAKVVQRADAVLDRVYDAIDIALENNDLRMVDAGSRAVVNLTRGIIQDRVELTPAKQTIEVDELTQLLLTHGVSLPAPTAQNATPQNQ